MTTPLASAAHKGIRGRPICRRSSCAGAVVGCGCVAVVVMVIPSPVFVGGRSGDLGYRVVDHRDVEHQHRLRRAGDRKRSAPATRCQRRGWPGCAPPACAGLGSDGRGRVDVSGVPAGESPGETHEREHEPLDQWWDRPATELAVVATE